MDQQHTRLRPSVEKGTGILRVPREGTRTSYLFQMSSMGSSTIVQFRRPVMIEKKRDHASPRGSPCASILPASTLAHMFYHPQASRGILICMRVIRTHMRLALGSPAVARCSPAEDRSARRVTRQSGACPQTCPAMPPGPSLNSWLYKIPCPR